MKQAQPLNTCPSQPTRDTATDPKHGHVGRDGRRRGRGRGKREQSSLEAGFLFFPNSSRLNTETMDITMEYDIHTPQTTLSRSLRMATASLSAVNCFSTIFFCK